MRLQMDDQNWPSIKKIFIEKLSLVLLKSMNLKIHLLEIQVYKERFLYT